MRSYYTVHDFMYDDLNLSGTDLYVFAFLYSFKEYSGSLSYLSKAVGVKSTTTIQSSLKRLIDLGFIKKEKSLNCFSTCRYIVLYKARSNKNVKQREWDRDEAQINNDVKIGVRL